MDTRFWGPSGWRLLHSISFAYNPDTDRAATQRVFESLPFVLPCKYCRTSLTEYMEEDPLEPALASRDSFTRWFWKIHNQVNAKLRNQKILKKQDPPFEKVRVFYDEFFQRGCSKTEFPGWDFLFSILDLYPIKGKTVVCHEAETLEEKNKANCLSYEEKLPKYKTFFLNLGKVLPFQEWRTSWKTHEPMLVESLESKSAAMRALWKLRCGMEADLELLNRCKYSHLCQTLKTYRSGCARSTRGKTCRRKQRDK